MAAATTAAAAATTAAGWLRLEEKERKEGTAAGVTGAGRRGNPDADCGNLNGCMAVISWFSNLHKKLCLSVCLFVCLFTYLYGYHLVFRSS